MGCSVTGCEGTSTGRLIKGLCMSHYARLRRHGDVQADRPLGAKADPGEPLKWLNDNMAGGGDECFLWPFGTTDGYAYLTTLGGRVARWVCEQSYGPPPSEEHEAAHSCRNPPCVNPRHLRWATVTENARDRILHGTWLHGETANSTLTEERVQAIRLAKGSGPGSRKLAHSLAAEHGVNWRAIYRVWSGETWAWLPQPELTSD